VLVYLEHAIQDARTDRAGNRRVISRQMQFIEVIEDGTTRLAGYAPYLDYRPPTTDEVPFVMPLGDQAWLREDVESKVLAHAVANIVPAHFEEIRKRKEELVSKTLNAVKERLSKEINYWDHRAAELKERELSGRNHSHLNSGLARQRADDLAGRLQKRLAELEQERKLSPLPPVVVGGALIVPYGLLAKLQGKTVPTFARETSAWKRWP